MNKQSESQQPYTKEIESITHVQYSQPYYNPCLLNFRTERFDIEDLPDAKKEILELMRVNNE